MNCFACIVACALAAVGSSQGRGQDWNGVPKTLAAHLTRGVNITRWFCYLDNVHDTAHLSGYCNDQDFASFRALNIRFVRLCVSPEAIYRSGHADTEVLKYIDAAIGKFDKAGIAVIWDLHDNGQMKLDADPSGRSGFVSFWREIAEHYKGKRETMMLFEPLNEPQFSNNQKDWEDVQKTTVEAIRAVDPKRTILATGAWWGGVDGMLAITPLPMNNIVYSYHCYDPFFFTHQGATWAGDDVKLYEGVPFPITPEGVAPLLPSLPEQQRNNLKWTAEQNYGDEYLDGRIKAASEWGKAHHVPVLLGEFGVLPNVAPPDSRARWFQVMRKALGKYDMPNSVWGYDDAFGLGRNVDDKGVVHLDELTMRELFGYVKPN